MAQSSEYQNEGQGFNGLLGGTIDFNDRNELSTTLRLNHYGSGNDRVNSTLVTSTLPANYGEVLTNDHNITDSKNASRSIDTNLDYTRKFKTKGQELNLLMLYSQSAGEGENYTVRETRKES